MPLQWWELMAILIPSKNIYGEIQNPKVRDNVIERIDVVAVEVLPNNDYETPVYQSEIGKSTQGQIQSSGKVRAYYLPTPDGNKSMLGIGASFIQLQTTYTDPINIEINKLLGTSYISKIYDGENSDGESNIKVSVYHKVVKEDIFIPFEVQENMLNQGEYTFSSPDITVVNKTENYAYNSIPQTYIDEKNNFVNVEDKLEIDQLHSIENVLSEYNQDNLKNTFFYTSPLNENVFKANGIIALSGVVVTKANHNKVHIGYYDEIIHNLSINLVGERTYYIPQKVEITIYGNTIGIDLVDKTVSTNSRPDKKAHSVEGNELMQTTNYKNKRECKIKIKNNFFGIYNFEVLEGDVGAGDILYRKGSDKKVTVSVDIFGVSFIDDTQSFAVAGEVVDCEVKPNHLTNNFNRTIDKYKNGKETAVIRCSISDYMDYSTNEKVISIEGAKKCFELYDEVIPMIYGADGVDKPMSLGNAGQAKAFTVIGTKIYYDGAVWQELTLQESETVYYISGTKTLQDLETVTLLSLNEEKLIEI